MNYQSSWVLSWFLKRHIYLWGCVEKKTRKKNHPKNFESTFEKTGHGPQNNRFSNMNCGEVGPDVSTHEEHSRRSGRHRQPRLWSARALEFCRLSKLTSLSASSVHLFLKDVFLLYPHVDQLRHFPRGQVGKFQKMSGATASGENVRSSGHVWKQLTRSCSDSLTTWIPFKILTVFAKMGA